MVFEEIVIKGDVDLLKSVIAMCPNAEVPKGLLTIAAKEGNLEMVKYLYLKENADDVEGAISVAKQAGHTEIVEILGGKKEETIDIQALKKIRDQVDALITALA